jgi:hypothetical protein
MKTHHEDMVAPLASWPQPNDPSEPDPVEQDGEE